MFESPDKSPKEAERGNPKKPESFLNKLISRRDFLKVIGILGAGKVSVEGVKDYRNFQKEELDQYGESPVVQATIELMHKLNLEVPKDKLYGFVYPTTGEMAKKYMEALNRKIHDTSSLIVTQERDPKTLIGSFVHRNRGITVPRVTTAGSPDRHSFLTLPNYMETYPPHFNVPILYHEGLHLFFQNPVLPYSSPEDIFQIENMPNIGDILVAESMRIADNRPEGPDIREIAKAYKEALERGDKSIWETYLKNLYLHM